MKSLGLGPKLLHMSAPTTDAKHIVCPSCSATNRLPADKLGQGTTARFNIRSIPTIALFRNGREVARQPGAMSAADIVRWVQQH